MSAQNDHAEIEQWTWKTPAMRAMTLAVVRLALDRGLSGEFSALDLNLRGAAEQGGTGIAGAVFHRLREARIIARVGVFVEGQFFPRSVVNDGGNPVGVYRLDSHGRALALLAVHAPAEAQTEEQLELRAG